MKKNIVSLLLAGTLALAAMSAAAPAGAAETADETEDTQEQRHKERGICDIIADQDGSFLAVDSCNNQQRWTSHYRGG